MSIRIGIKNIPFSHDLGAKCVLPNSPYRATFYPTKIVCAAIEIPLEHTGPLKKFTVFQHLDKGFVRVCGETPQGRVSYRFFHQGTELVLFDERKKIAVRNSVIQEAFPKEHTPQLSFGCHKKQDVYHILKRMNPEEYLPLLYQIGIGYPEESLPEGSLNGLLKKIEVAITSRNRLEIISSFEQFLRVGIESMFSPVLHDAYHTGMIQGHLNVSPHIILAKLARLIQRMVFVEEGVLLDLLPAVAPELHHGKIVGIPFSLGTIDIEWTKKKLRLVQIHVKKAGRIELQLQKDIQSYRLVKHRKKETSLHFPGDVHTFESGQTYTLDRFKK